MLRILAITIIILVSIGVPVDAQSPQGQDAAAVSSTTEAAPESNKSSKVKDTESNADNPDDGISMDDKIASDTMPDTPGVFEKIIRSGATGLLLKGGFFMWPILILGIIASGVIIERYRSLKMLTTDSGAVRAKVQELLYEDRVEDALKLCDREQGPVPALLLVGLRKFLLLRRLDYDPGKIEEQVVKAMDDCSSHVVAALERHLPILATVSSVAPMLGFLGTVHGMIIAFQDIVEKMGDTNIVEAAASGISVALLTTCFGLIVGIPAFIAFNYFTSVINRFILEVEESATDLIETVTLHLALEQKTKPETEDSSCIK